MSDVLFRTSLYGRFGHLVMGVLGLILGIACGIPFLLPGPSGAELLVLVGCGALSAGGLAIALYSVWFTFAPGGRIRASNEALFYRGFFGSIHLPWLELESAHLNYAGRSPFVFLLVRRRGARSLHKLNVSGLTPTYQVLLELVRSRAPHAVRSSKGYGLAEAVVGESADEL